jgi:diguanylate cyclase (GGDEF)-like protein/PAS domain S-box-containing protein
VGDTEAARLRAELRAVEARLAASEGRAAEAERIAGVGWFDLDLRTGRQTGSAQMFRIFGLDPAVDLPTDVVMPLVHPDDRAAVDAIVGGAASDPSPYELELRIVRPDGELRWILARGEGVRDASGAVVRIVGTNQDITERKLLEEQLSRQALHDPLSGLANRALLRDRMGHALTRATRSGECVALLVIDLDDFKAVNDSRGHAAGDEVLATVAQRLMGCVRDADTVARIGGDEFAVLLEGVCDDDAARTAERVLAEVRVPVNGRGPGMVVRASVGVALDHGGGEDGEALLRHADLAMYTAKRGGKGQYRVFTPTMRSAVVDRLRLDEELRQAVTALAFRLHYQPVVEMATGRVEGFEALLRWDRPGREAIGPEVFVPLLEEAGLIIALGEWVLRQACTQGAAWQDRFGRPFTMSVNVSPHQLRSPDFVHHVGRALAASDLPPSSLVIEITEGVLVSDVEQVIATLGQLKALGVRAAVDDFGTGYSSLRYLQRLPVDAIKIDRSFVATMEQGNEQAALVEAIVNVGRALHLSVVAEGVETVEQSERLQSLGCRLGQGYLFSAPTGIAGVEAQLRGSAQV